MSPTTPNAPRLLMATAAAIAGIAAFWIYSLTRAMQATTGFPPGQVGLSCLLALVVVGVLAWGMWAVHPVGRALRVALLAWIAVGFAAGCAVGEAAIQVDEARFATEAQRFFDTNPAAQWFSRDRAWPNGGTSLVAARDGAMHATD